MQAPAARVEKKGRLSKVGVQKELKAFGSYYLLAQERSKRDFIIICSIVAVPVADVFFLFSSSDVIKQLK